MWVKEVRLADFRSYEQVEVTLAPGVTTFVGANGQGKTNLVEAIEYLSRLGSHRVSTDAPLVQAGTDQAVVRAEVVAGRDDPRKLLLELEINPGRANRGRINRAPLARTHDLLGALRSVVFSPEDLALVKGDPAARRGFLDDLVVSRWPRMLGVKQDYDKVLRQRNTLLKSLLGTRPGPDDEFTIDDINRTVTCPNGITVTIAAKGSATFGPRCTGCPLRSRCTANTDGKVFSVGDHDQLLAAARQQWPSAIPAAHESGHRPATPARRLLSSLLVLDHVEALLAQAGEVVEHPLQHLGGMALPLLNFVDHAHRVWRAVRAGDVAGEPLVGDVRVVLERPSGLDHVDAAERVAPGAFPRQLGRPHGRLEQCGEVDVVRHATLLVVREVAGHEEVAHLPGSAQRYVQNWQRYRLGLVEI